MIQGDVGVFNNDPMALVAASPFAPYIMVDDGYLLMGWCITPVKVGLLGIPLMKGKHGLATNTSQHAWVLRVGLAFKKHNLKR